MSSRQEMPSEAKEIVDGTVHHKKPLCLSRRFELTHLALMVARRLMRDFRSVV